MVGLTMSHFRILEKLGCGGMGVVCKAQDAKLNRTIALKFLPEELSQSQRFEEVSLAISEGRDRPCRHH